MPSLKGFDTDHVSITPNCLELFDHKCLGAVTAGTDYMLALAQINNKIGIYKSVDVFFNREDLLRLKESIDECLANEITKAL